MRPTIVLLFLLSAFFLPAITSAQHGHHDHDGPAIPSSLRVEHEQIHHELSALFTLGGRTAEAARAVAEALHEHFEAEEEFAMPPLGALEVLAKGHELPYADEVLRLSETLQRKMPTMLAEHDVIRQKVEALRAAAQRENQPAALAFADRLQLHAQNEEQILYPSAILIGKYIDLLRSTRRSDIK